MEHALCVLSISVSRRDYVSAALSSFFCVLHANWGVCVGIFYWEIYQPDHQGITERRRVPDVQGPCCNERGQLHLCYWGLNATEQKANQACSKMRVGLFCLRSCILLSAETVGASMRSCRHGLTWCARLVQSDLYDRYQTRNRIYIELLSGLMAVGRLFLLCELRTI